MEERVEDFVLVAHLCLFPRCWTTELSHGSELVGRGVLIQGWTILQFKLQFELLSGLQLIDLVYKSASLCDRMVRAAVLLHGFLLQRGQVLLDRDLVWRVLIRGSEVG